VVLEEENPTGRWTTEITAVEHERGGGWVSVDVTSDNGQFVAVPHAARYLLQALPLLDGGVELRGGAQVFGADRIPELRELLEAQDRRGAVFVAGTDDQLPFEPFRSRVSDWLAQADGLAHVVVLDPAATAELARVVGEPWATPPWTIRTYLPGLDRTGPARQHRILSTARLAKDSDRYLRTLLGGFARAIVAEHPTPAPLVSWRRRFDRLENATLTRAMTSQVEQAPENPLATIEQPGALAIELNAPLTVQEVEESTIGAEATAYLAELERVRAALAVPDLTNETLQRLAEQATAPRTDPQVLADAARRIERQQARIEDLEAALGDLQGQLLDEQVEHLMTQEEQQGQTDRATWLGQQLVAAGQHDVAFATLPEAATTAYPTSYAELMERSGELEALRVVITADPGTVLELDTVDSSGKALRNAWDSLLVLGDYARARRAKACTGNVHQYLCNTPTGYRGMPPGKHAWNETATTMNQYGDERLLAVPAEVSETGFAEMRAHFKLGRIGMASPRLHYLDDVAGTGKVYVGYIGTHLTNTKTN